MADISTFTPSPPGIGEPSLPVEPSPPHPLPSRPPSDSPKQGLIPKSTLYGERTSLGTPTSPSSSLPGMKPQASTTPPTPASSSSGVMPSSNVAEVPLSLTAAADGSPPSGEGPNNGRAASHLQQEPGNGLAIAPEAQGSAGEVQEESSPSPGGVNPSPNLYPNVHVNPSTPNPVTALVLPSANSSSTPTVPPASSSSSAAQQDACSPPSQTQAAPSFPSEAAELPPASSQVQPPPPPPQDAKPLQTAAPSTPSLSKPQHPIRPASCSSTSSTGPATPSASKRALEPPGTPTLVVQESPGPTLAPPAPRGGPALDSLSYLESASLMSGTLESLSGLGEDGSSVGSDSEINGLVMRRTDKYGFLGGTQYSESSEKELKVEVARQREMKWLDMFNHWDKWIIRRFQKVKLRCRKGIPSSLRAKAWQLLSNSKELLEANPGKFEELEREPGDPKWLDIIEKDLHRQFPFHEMFAARGGHGQQDLYRILKAYTVYRPDEGYCQAQAPVAAVLLMHMPAEQAFWCLVQICDKYLPGYYSAGLEAIQLDGEIFFSLLRRVCPMAYRHLKKFKIDPILYMTEWFMCIFSRTLPWASVLRVWDMFFCEGVKVVFRVGLVLLKQMLGSVDKLRELQGMYETMERLRNIPPESIREDLLIQEIITLPVTEALIERECSVQVRKWRESRGELTHQPARRLNGTRAIFEQKRRAAAISSGGSLSFLGAPIPPPGPLRASSSLLSLPGFRKSKGPFHQAKKSSLSGPSGAEAALDCSGFGSIASSGGRGPQVPHGPSPLIGGGVPATAPSSSAVAAGGGGSSGGAEHHNLTSLPPSGLGQGQGTAARSLPSPKVVAEQVTPTIPSPTANNAPLPPCPSPCASVTPGATGGGGGTAPTAPAAPAATGVGEDDGKKKKKSKEEKKREKEEEKHKAREKKDREKAEKERQKKEKERLEKEKKKAGKKKDKGSASGGDVGKNGSATAQELT